MFITCTTHTSLYHRRLVEVQDEKALLVGEGPGFVGDNNVPPASSNSLLPLGEADRALGENDLATGETAPGEYALAGSSNACVVGLNSVPPLDGDGLLDEDANLGDVGLNNEPLLDGPGALNSTSCAPASRSCSSRL